MRQIRFYFVRYFIFDFPSEKKLIQYYKIVKLD